MTVIRAFDAAGWLITTILPNGVVSVNAYDDANRLTSLRHEAADSSLLAEYLYQLDGVGNRVAITETVRAPHGEQVIEAYVEQNGLLVVEAEKGTATASASHDWVTQTVQSGYEGTGYSRALPDIGARYEETETASSPQLSWPIYNETSGTYSVWVRGMAPDAGGDSLHVGLDGGTPSTAADLTGFTNEWAWSRVTPSGDATLDLTATGEHTLEAWMREDGLRVDRVLLVTDTNYIPSGLGPSESPFQTITETVPGGLGTTTISYSYDALYRLTDAAYTGAITATFAYDYDSVGNMTAFTETVDAQTTSVSRTFDVANRLEYAVDASGTTTYTYDANGNLIELLPPGATGANPVGGVRYDYDQRNLMVSQETNPDGAGWVLQAEYIYDGGNDRLQQVNYTGATPITTTYTNDVFGMTQVLVADEGTTQVYNLFGLDLISQDSDAEVRTLLVDGLGSVRLEMVGGLVETATTYTPYGEVLEQAGMSGTVYGFTGEQEDSATGLLYLRARYYDSSLKTFMSRDPFEGVTTAPGSYNGYNYANDNPVMFVDPTGRWICTPDSHLFNPECEEWVNDALDKLENQGGVPGQRLVAFFERRDSDLKWDTLGCIVFPPLAGRIWGIQISFTPLIRHLPGRPGGVALPPDRIFMNSTRINGGTAALEEVATFGHEISHLEQGFPAFFSVHAEMLSGILAFRLESELNVEHHQEGEIIRIGRGPGQPFDPWDLSDLRAFKNAMEDAGMSAEYPLLPITGFLLQRNWFDQWGVAPFRPPTPPPSPPPTPPLPTGPAQPPTPPPPGGTPTPPR